MGISQEHQVDFSRFEIDLRELADSRLLSQFIDSTNLKNLIYCFIDEIQELLDAVADMMRERTLYDAADANLDSLGLIVGQPRESIEVSTFSNVYFTPDFEGLGADQGVAYVPGGRAGIGRKVIDSQYRDLIFGRILSNANKSSSVPYLADLIWKVLGIRASFELAKDEPMAVDIKVYSSLTPFQAGFLTLAHPIITAEKAYYMPYPATLKIRSITVIEDVINNVPGVGSLSFGLPGLG